MGRLFWKFFLVILLGQLVTVATVGVMFWLHEPRHWKQGSATQSITPEETPNEHAPPAATQEIQPSAQYPRPPHARPRRFRKFPLLPLAVGALASFALAFLLARHISRPILGLRRAFEAIALGDFSLRLTPQLEGRKDELADLGRDFDRTAEQLQILMDSQRRLLHDVSHEIRSPLARIQLALDLAQQQPDKTSASIARIQRESNRIEKLVGELLTLSRLEARAFWVDEEDNIDVVILLAEMIEDASFEAAARHCEIKLVVNSAAPIRGRMELLHRAFENIIRNAIAYTISNTRISVSVTAGGQTLKIEVADEGPGIPEIALQSIFEPFVRLRDERSKDESAGYGLGLAIARQVIDAHGGSISAQNRAGGGLLVGILLPITA